MDKTTPTCSKCSKPRRANTDGQNFCREHALEYYNRMLQKLYVRYNTADPRGAEKGKILKHQIKPVEAMINLLIEKI